MATLHRLLYSSHCALDCEPDEVDAQVVSLVENAQQTNARHGITGALLFSSGMFVQALEGPLEAVEATFERICADMRHRDLRLIDFTIAETRAFGEWSMAAINPRGSLENLGADFEAMERMRMDQTNADAAIRIMRSMLTADTVRPHARPSADVSPQRLSGVRSAG
ncbi:BLUF domain-containing protein [Plastoroseomonas arctica]|uniref:BLUF domain-containing protein n=1 Tax=Plastoroseomonas arctica TaxID=1509237 RepID=A0AAF1JYZ0_9PROT|nr:BLUF domain-containing protein [Plastoroseomonas arctica]MBR0655328.1 BLUF domain-containing protein [Plastoroseomonas arctica]